MPKPQPQFEAPWDKRDVARYLGITASGVDKLMAAGRAPPYFHAGRLVRWRPDVVRAWVHAQEQLAGAGEAAE